MADITKIKATVGITFAAYWMVTNVLSKKSFSQQALSAKLYP